jgi:hypothetical protein
MVMARMSMRVRVALVYASVGLAGCALAPHGEWFEVGSGFACVVNDGLGTMALYQAGSPARLGSVEPGRWRCLRLLPSEEPLVLLVRAEGVLYRTPPAQRSASVCWWLRVGTTPALDVLSLEPGDCPRRRSG